MTINRLALLLALPQVTVVSSLAYKNVTDDYISDSVRQKLAADSVVKGGAIEVDVKDGAVTLTGICAGTTAEVESREAC